MFSDARKFTFFYPLRDRQKQVPLFRVLATWHIARCFVCRHKHSPTTESRSTKAKLTARFAIADYLQVPEGALTDEWML